MMNKEADFTDELLPEYDLKPLLKNAVRGKYTQHYIEEKPRAIIDVINDIKPFRHEHRLDGESLREMIEEGRE